MADQTFMRGEFPARMNNPILNFIRRLTFLDMENGPWVAGGALLRIALDQPFGGDIDIFVKGEGGFAKSASLHDLPATAALHQMPDLASWTREKKSGNCNFLFGSVGDSIVDAVFSKAKIPRVKVQLINQRRFASAEALISDLDFTCVMMATDGWRWVADSRFHEDVRERRLVMNNDQKRINQLRRMTKYCLRGFTPTPGVLRSILHTEDLAFKDIFDKNLIVNQQAYY